MNGKAWLGVIGMVVGLITGGFGSAAVGSKMYNKLETKFESHVSDQFQEDIATRERLATIETEIKNTNRLLEEIRDELKK